MNGKNEGEVYFKIMRYKRIMKLMKAYSSIKSVFVGSLEFKCGYVTLTVIWLLDNKRHRAGDLYVVQQGYTGVNFMIPMSLLLKILLQLDVCLDHLLDQSSCPLSNVSMEWFVASKAWLHIISSFKNTSAVLCIIYLSYFLGNLPIESIGCDLWGP